MSHFSIIIPEATTNLVTNPSVETNTTGYAAFDGAAIARSSLYSVDGLWSLAVTPSAGLSDGVYYVISLTAGITYTFSVYVWGALNVAYNIWAANPGVTNFTPTNFTGMGTWQLVETTITPLATATHWLLVTKVNNASVAVFYIDALQCEAKAYRTTHCNGSIDPPIGFTSSGCTWAGITHASTSSRSAASRAGGRERDLEDVYGLYISNIVGAGAPPVRNLYTPYAMLPGALYERVKIDARVFTLLGTIIDSTSLLSLHSKRSTLYVALGPDTVNNDPILIRYSGADRKLEISAFYDGGLELGMLFLFNENIGIRFVAPDPYWREVIE